jgi:hypothetical protein
MGVKLASTDPSGSLIFRIAVGMTIDVANIISK